MKVDREQAEIKTAQPKITGKRKQAKKGAMTGFAGVSEANQTAATTKASSPLKTMATITPVDTSKTITPVNASPRN